MATAKQIAPNRINGPKGGSETEQRGAWAHCQPQTMRVNRETNPICHNSHVGKELTDDFGVLRGEHSVSPS